MRAPHSQPAAWSGVAQTRASHQPKQRLLRVSFATSTFAKNSAFLLGYRGVRLDLTLPISIIVDGHLAKAGETTQRAPLVAYYTSQLARINASPISNSDNRQLLRQLQEGGQS